MNTALPVTLTLKNVSPLLHRKLKDQARRHKRSLNQRLRFSLSGEPKIEEAWSRHFVVVGKRNPFAAPESDGL